MTVSGEPTLPPAPPAGAAKYFGERFSLAEAYVGLLATEGVLRGLIGPREVSRLWERHVLNCAVVAELVPTGATVVDVGSGAGLPGIAMALVRPDLDVVLLEPLLRRTTFLAECVTELGLDRVRVLRGRAEEQAGQLTADVVTSRAVAPLERLARWCLPLTGVAGEMLAVKGGSAAEELERAEPRLRALGATESAVLQVGVGVIDPPTTVVRIRGGKARSTRRKR